MTSTRPRLFYGWWIVLVCAVGLFLGPTPIGVFSAGVFLKPLAQEFHSGRGAISLAFALQHTMTAFGLPFAGRLIDHFGARKVILPSTFVVGLTLLSAYFCSGRIWQLYLFYLALGLGTCASGVMAYSCVISRWFDRYRGLALGMTMLGLGAGALIMPPTAQYLIARFGWRITFAIAGATILLVTLPVLTMCLKDRPEVTGLLPDGSPYAFVENPRLDVDPGLTWGEAWRAPTFWLLFCSFILVSVSVQACLTHIPAILGDRGSPAETAALASSLFGGGLLLGRTGSGYLLDRFFAPRVATVIFGCAAAGIGLLRIGGSQELAFAAAFLIGFGQGAEADIMAYLTTRYFGLRCFGAIYSFVFAGYVLSGGLGGYLMGAAFDATGSYRLALSLLCIATFVGAALMMRVGPYRYQKRLPAERGPELEILPSEA
jgi:MFS family permease